VNGVCGTSHAKRFASAPTLGLCTTGIPSIVVTSDNTAEWRWNCDGNNGGMECKAYKPINAACGALSGATITGSVDTKKLCAPGTLQGNVATSSTGRLSWVCAGLNFGNSKSCSALKKINATCGTASGTTVGTIPTTGLCGE
jgi:hypothetical protein